MSILGAYQHWYEIDYGIKFFCVIWSQETLKNQIDLLHKSRFGEIGLPAL